MAETGRRYTINREAMTVREFLHDKLREEQLSTSVIKIPAICSVAKCKNVFLDKLPFLRMMRNYQLSWLLIDIFGGLSNAALQVPQALTFSILIGIPTYLGLYASLYSSLVYFFFGTSLHMTMGPNVLLGLILVQVLQSQTENFHYATASQNVTEALYSSTSIAPTDFNGSDLSTMASVSTTHALTAEDPALTYFKIEIVATITFMVGVVQIIGSCLQLGLVAEFFSPQFLVAFMVASSFHIMTGQVGFVFGISKYVKQSRSATPLPYMWSDILNALPKTNTHDVMCFCVSFVILVLYKEFIAVKYKAKLKFPVPIDFLVITAACLVSYLTTISRYGVRVIGPIKTGLIAPTIPTFPHLGQYIQPVLTLVFIMFSYNISLAKTVSKNYSYVVKDNQELLAYGLCNLAVSFFQSYPCACSPVRTFILVNLKTKTLVTNLSCAVFITLVCLGVSKVFEYLPLSCMAAVIYASFIPLQREYLALPKLFRNNKYDFAIWTLTWLAMMSTNITYGILVGFLLSFVMVLVKARFTHVVFMHKSDVEDIFVEGGETFDDLLTILDNNYCEENFGLKNVYVVKYNSFLFFANIAKFIFQLQELLTVVAQIQLNFRPQQEDEWKTLLSSYLKRRSTVGFKEVFSVAVILDCSAICYVDTAAALALKNIITECRQSHICLALASCNQQVLTSLLDMERDLPDLFYPTVLDAIQTIKFKFNLKSVGSAKVVSVDPKEIKSIQSVNENSVRVIKDNPVHSVNDKSVQPVNGKSVHSINDKSVHSINDTSVHSIKDTSVHSNENRSLDTSFVSLQTEP